MDRRREGGRENGRRAGEEERGRANMSNTFSLSVQLHVGTYITVHVRMYIRHRP